ncbi:MAG: glycosyl transferase [Pseudomonadota bacterium]
MSDFFQNGQITTLHWLRERTLHWMHDRPLEQIERELVRFSSVRPMALVLPTPSVELGRPELAGIIEHLRQIPYIADVVIALEDATPEQYRHARELFAVLPQRTHLLWLDGPRFTALEARLAETGLAPRQPGKGRAVWYAFGHVLMQCRSEAVALHDCDITTFSRDLPARLFYPVANPSFTFDFCKGYYARVEGDHFSGRVTRLFITPLLRALKKVLGPLDFIEYLDSFRYPLAGEFALRSSMLAGLRIQPGLGLEVSVLSEAYRSIARNRICQVDIAALYDHAHQRLSAEERERGLARMTVEIGRTLFCRLAAEGVVLSEASLRSIKEAYYWTAVGMLGQFRADATFNGLVLDLQAEEKLIELFARSIITAWQEFLANPGELAQIPHWARVRDVLPEVGSLLQACVHGDAVA